MKNVFRFLNSTLLVITFFNVSNSQTYQPMVIEGNRWDGATIFGMGATYPRSSFICGDTIIDNIKYSLVKQFSVDDTYTILDESPLQVYCIREDTLNKKVFTKTVDGEYLFADFGMEIGDSIFLYNRYYKVQNYSIENIFGQERRVQHVNYQDSMFDFNFRFIEGYGIWPSGVFQVENYYTVHGFSNDPSFCDLITKIDDLSLREIDIYPNPVSSILYLSIPKVYDPIHFAVFNSIGEIVQKGQIIDRDEINISQLPSGTYYLRMEGVVTKFLKL